MITGKHGMLGKALMGEAKKVGHVVEAVDRWQVPIHDPRPVRDALNAVRPAILINAAGVIPLAHADGDYNTEMVLANALGPQVLAAECRRQGIRLIHVSTDCVFSGQPPVAIHSVSELPDAADVYGRSKLVGESIVLGDHPLELITVVRTSFIGFDHGLLHWLLEETQDGDELTGFTRAWWSGSTVGAVARALVAMAADPPGGIQHLATARAISKHALLRMLIDGLVLNRRLLASEAPFIGRGLIPTIDLPAWEDEIAALAHERARRGI